MEHIPPWLNVGLGVAGFLLTWGGIWYSWGKIVGSINVNTATQIALLKEDFSAKLDKLKEDTAEKVASETSEIKSSIAELSHRFDEDQRIQDNRFGEVAIAIREYVAKVEKEMHQIEIWGRDNYVLKSDFLLAAQRIEMAIKEMRGEIKDDIKSLDKKVAAIPGPT